MTLRIYTILILVLTLASCRQNKCDFNSYIQTINFIDKPYTFKSMADLGFHIASSRDCDSVFFGKDYSSIGIIYKYKELYSVLLESNGKIFLTTLDLNGHTIDKMELVQNNGFINDSLSVWSTYQLQKDNSFCRIDTIERSEYDKEGNQYTVAIARVDTFKYSSGKIILK